MRGGREDLAAGERWPNFFGNVVGFDILLCSPTLKVSSLAVVAIICKPELRSDQVDEFVINDDPTIIVDRHMSHRPTINTVKKKKEHSDVE
jgi:hypothetical protein